MVNTHGCVVAVGILNAFVLAMIKEVVKQKIGIKPESSSASEKATEGTEDTSEPKRTTIEAGKHSVCTKLVNPN